MKVLTFTILVVVTITLISCGKSTYKQPANAEGFKVIEKELKSKFGKNAYYTDLSIAYNKSIGNIISVTVTDNPESLEMGQWNQTQSTWKQNSEISLQVPNGSKAADFMFQLNGEINLSKLGELVEKSSKQLKIDKKLEKTTLHMAFIKFPKNGDFSKTEYTVILKPENGGTTFTFFYKLNGDLIKINY
jgi:predicted ATP-grasp superfamily ATP-dependent carboligase